MTTATTTASRKRLYIDGQWCDADSGQTLGIINPATEEVICEVAYGGRAEARRALEAAAKAMPGWMKLTAWERAKVLKKTAELMRERGERHRPHDDSGTGQTAGRSRRRRPCTRPTPSNGSAKKANAPMARSSPIRSRANGT